MFTPETGVACCENTSNNAATVTQLIAEQLSIGYHWKCKPTYKAENENEKKTHERDYYETLVFKLGLVHCYFVY